MRKPKLRDWPLGVIKKGQIEFPEEFSGPKSNQNDTMIANPLRRPDEP